MLSISIVPSLFFPLSHIFTAERFLSFLSRRTKHWLESHRTLLKPVTESIVRYHFDINKDRFQQEISQSKGIKVCGNRKKQIRYQCQNNSADDHHRPARHLLWTRSIIFSSHCFWHIVYSRTVVLDFFIRIQLLNRSRWGQPFVTAFIMCHYNWLHTRV